MTENEFRTKTKRIPVVDEAEKDDTVAPVKYDITSFGADYDVEGLVNRLNREDILIPSFQRDYVWNQREASRFIESLLLGLPVPGVFFARDTDSKKLVVIDGQQRLKTLQFFYEGFFNPKPGAITKRVFKLIFVQKQFEGFTYKTLKDEDRIILNDSIIHATIVKQESPRDENTSIYHIFERLNTEGRKLTPQQIRVAIYHGKLIDAVKMINKHPNWRKIYGAESTTLKDQELIIRFLAMYFKSDDYSRPMKEFLNTFVKKNRNPNGEYLEKCKDLFINTVDTVYKGVGYEAFKPERALNAAVFDSVMVGIAKKISKGVNIRKLKIAYNDLITNERYLKAISQSTSDDKNVKLRFDIVTEKFSDI